MRKLPEYIENHPIVPYIRQSGFSARRPWLLPERRLLDYLLLYVQEGRFRLQVDGENYELSGGDFALVQPNSIVALQGVTEMITPFMHLDIFFNRKRADSFATRPGQIDLSEYRHLLQPRLNDFEGIHVPVHFTVKRPVAFREKLLSIVQLLEAPVAFNPLQVQVLASDLVLAIVESHTASAAAASPPAQSLNWVTSFLSFHLSERVKVEDLARRAGFSPSRFTTLFKERFGITPYRHLFELRIQSAKDLLTTTAMSQEEIAGYCGFHDIHHFHKMFKKETGITPKQYRGQTKI